MTNNTFEQYATKPQSNRIGKQYVDGVNHFFPSAIIDEEWQTDNQVTITVKMTSLVEVMKWLYYDQGGWLTVTFGNDERSLNGHFAVYHALSMEGEVKSWVTVKVLVDANSQEFISITPTIPAAVWGEREVRDMYGLRPVGLPDERRLVLPDDWPEDLHPLRKDAMDYRQRPQPTTETETYQFDNQLGDDSNRIVPVGPLHITSDEPGHFRLFVDGEDIVDADYRMFYVHRGMEKLAETRMGYHEVAQLTDRVCGICGFTHSVGYSNTIENALSVDVPFRAKMIRTVLLEVERLHSHLLNIGLSSHFVGFDSGFMQFFRVREKTMELAELLTGARKTYGMNLIGGVRRDFLKEQRLKGIAMVKEVRKTFSELVEVLLATPNIESRIAGVGILSKDIARDYSPVGPLIRASGFKRDVRIVHGQSLESYGSVPIELQSMENGDVQSRVMVRIREVFDSLNIVEYGLDHLPPGAILTEGFNYVPNKFALGFTEAPRGENVHWSMTGDNQKLFRWRCRAATYANWPTLRYMLRGNTVADAPLIIGSLDPCYSCTDRVTIVDTKKKRSKTIPYKAIEQYSIDRKNSPFKL
ncbi:hydrogenase large subunit [Photobacterium leiognathi]|uniref:Hydrogenase 3 large subunit n=1 Tax=Photobacterium leiognathi subsp. mandapamensis TaxID=48408 RepID=A0A2T3KPQ1_PHOLD|nr:hydrogenase large subunit [Photobacterium leiognathi]PHZ59913.1 hydrogenase 3 large subunit [Photobacterium leiognathi]PSU98302.1 hydrogenase 3 large subunit [Photobacterium leiognathi subsp. mandapamensis]PSV06607.1 hydrogenase 3 large subunit [Photobacterium leiognathi subsp. mandapamensis]PSV20985.1 hydrogenase 3 large subunit [Photobacterium leiognathi subsp. mandapamensis]PSW46502.1 hydrogenase 3 large subunit [Photobacterium leiognathi subsp. mandapamensis]